jgi:flagellar hook-length control protein FliK
MQVTSILVPPAQTGDAANVKDEERGTEAGDRSFLDFLADTLPGPDQGGVAPDLTQIVATIPWSAGGQESELELATIVSPGTFISPELTDTTNLAVAAARAISEAASQAMPAAGPVPLGPSRAEDLFSLRLMQNPEKSGAALAAVSASPGPRTGNLDELSFDALAVRGSGSQIGAGPGGSTDPATPARIQPAPEASAATRPVSPGPQPVAAVPPQVSRLSSVSGLVPAGGKEPDDIADLPERVAGDSPVRPHKDKSAHATADNVTSLSALIEGVRRDAPGALSGSSGPGDAQATVQSGATDGPRFSGSAGHSEPHLARHVAHQLAQALATNGPGQSDILLDPEELGRVRMSLQAGDATISMVIQADRPETADLMRRHLDQLALDFKAMGYQDISFSFAGQGREHDRGDQEQEFQASDNIVRSESRPVAAPPGRTAAPGSLDLRL